MKIALITIHNVNNYGAVLQTYALQKILSSYGEVNVLDYDNRHISRSLDLIRIVPSIHGFLGIAKDICRLNSRYRTINKFNQFINKYINLSKEFGKYDIYISGSDQIWNPSCISADKKIDYTYFLDFAPKDAKKISYASSIGNYIYNKEEQKEVKRLLSSFFKISVREKDGQSQLMSLFNKSVEHVLDPTLLLTKEQWKKNFNLEEHNEKEKYILVYSVPKSPLIRSTTEYFKKKLGLKVISIDQDPFTFSAIDQHIKDAGPLNYLELFLNAEFIITDSFHGTCFSVNFGKQFVAVSPGVYSNRIENLLEILNLKHRIIKEYNCYSGPLNIIDYKVVNEILDNQRNKSLEYIKSVF